jgi:hypothetical protein
MLDAIERVFSKERNLHIKAFVIADRDYRFDDELASERSGLAGRHFDRQTWHVWERVEIENYLLLPSVIVRRVRSGLRNEPLFCPAEEMILQEIEVILEASRDAVRKRLMDSFGRMSRETKQHWEPSTILEKAEQFLASRWRGQDRLIWCDAKDIVLPRLRERSRAWKATLSDRELIGEVQPEEVPGDLKRAMAALRNFILG